MEKIKFLEHTADVKFQAFGESIEEAFENSAMALKKTITKGLRTSVKEKINKKIKITGKDYESLLYNFLEEFLYLLDAEDFLISKIKSIKINKSKKELNAEVLGDKASDYKFSNDVKAVTYNEMFVKQDSKGKYTAQVVLDV